MKSFSNIQEGANSLLSDTIKILNENDVNYIIVGGWSPFLLNSGEIVHPGTKDVDILFEVGYKEKELKDISQTFIDSGFILSAKHDFQLFKKIKVNDYEMIYNIDLLHPHETSWKKKTYVDHLELDLPASKYQSKNFMIKSIALPNSSILFDSFFVDHEIDFPLSDGTSSTQKMKLMSELGCLITKSQSVKVEKRFRDSFDIYLSIAQSQDLDDLVRKTLSLRKTNREVYNSLYGIREVFENGTMFSNASNFFELSEVSFNSTMTEFIEKTRLNEEAENIDLR